MSRSGYIGVSRGRALFMALSAVTVAASPSFGQSPAPYDLSVVIRDFTKDHPDFNLVPAVGYGYYFGNVAFDLDSEGKPVFTGEGALAGRLWKDSSNRPIAPHLFNTCNFAGGEVIPGDPGVTSFAVTVDESVEVSKYSLVDSFDSTVGPYGGDNIGESALVMANGNGTDEGHSYVDVTHRSKVMGDVMVHPDDDPAVAVSVRKRSSVSGEVGNMATPANIAAAEQPVPDLGPSVGKVRHRRGVHTLSEDLHCKSLSLDRRATLTVTGDVTIWCDGDFELDRGSVLAVNGNVVIRCDGDFVVDDKSELRMMEGATLMMYVGRELKVDDRSKLNMNTGNPQLVSVVMMAEPDEDAEHGNHHKHHGHHERHDRRAHRSKSRVTVDDRSRAAAWVQGVDAVLSVDDRSEFFGSFMGRRMEVTGRSSMHVDMASGEPTDGEVVFAPEECDLGDVAGTVVTAATGDVLSADTFSEWWRNVLGVNQSMVQTIRMTPNASGVYAYLNDDYRPINGLLLGNEGDANNYHFTAEIDADFTYVEGGGQWFEIRCTDDAYLFINGRLVIDLGGYGFNKVMRIDLDRLGLTDGESYPLQLFHAQRQHGLGIFRLQTNMVLADGGGASSSSVTGILED